MRTAAKFSPSILHLLSIPSFSLPSLVFFGSLRRTWAKLTVDGILLLRPPPGDFLRNLICDLVHPVGDFGDETLALQFSLA